MTQTKYDRTKAYTHFLISLQYHRIIQTGCILAKICPQFFLNVSQYGLAAQGCTLFRLVLRIVARLFCSKVVTAPAFAAEMMKGIEILTAARPLALETVYHQYELLLYSWQVGRVAALGFAI